MARPNQLPARDLTPAECRHYRDQLRAARYAALADAEAFGEICFALEALGLHLLRAQGDLKQYEDRIGFYARQSPVLNELAKTYPANFKTFEALYEAVRNARNDAMHTGAYARHATVAAIELCIGLEEALMASIEEKTVGSVMVKSPIVVEAWQPLAHARHLMLMHSFSFLPMRHQNSWWLLSELGLAKFLNVSNTQKGRRLGLTIADAIRHDPNLELIEVEVRDLLTPGAPIDALLRATDAKQGPTLWLVVDQGHRDHLAGVLSPFELM